MEVSLNFRKYIKLLMCSVSDFFLWPRKGQWLRKNMFRHTRSWHQNFRAGKLTTFREGTHDMYLHDLGWLVVEPCHLKHRRKSNWIISPNYRCENVNKIFELPPPSRALHASFWNKTWHWAFCYLLANLLKQCSRSKIIQNHHLYLAVSRYWYHFTHTIHIHVIFTWKP